jgi:hypothetical protein
MIYYFDGDSYQWVTTSSGIVGPQGAQGTMGTQGITGAQGASGFNGAQGSQGTQGIQGVQGIQGIQGEQGIQGIQGVQGTQGTQGIQGIQGTQGTQGIQGEQGIQGIQGIQGTQGTQGIQGTQGTQGIQGIQGIQGTQGTQGTQGLQGIAGYQGINGAQGTQGVQGIQGVQGTQGAQGLTGSQGTAGTFGGAAFDYTFDTSTTNADPGTGKLRLSNADLSLASALYINENDDLSVSIYNFLQTIDDSTSTIKGHFTITQKNDTNNFALFSITGAHSHGTNYFNVPVAYLSGATSFTNALDIIITFARTGDVGATGAQGTQGIQGIQGVQGTQGIQGEQGIQGIQGIQGVQGTQGIQGIQGAQGTQGIQGVQGAQGTQGIQGIQGTQGIQGVQGLQGIQGVQGTAGYIGADGAQGTIGTQGAQGLQGIQGIQGVQGIQGTQGTQGVQGITGVNANVLTSDTAPVSPNAGDLWWDSSVGMLRIYYNDGTSSQWVDVDPGSVQGIQGIQGVQGAQGIQGIQGAQGTQGTVGSQGAVGSQGTQGIQGISGASILGTNNTWTGTNAFTTLSSTLGANFATSSGSVGIGTTSTTGKINALADANGTGLAIIAGSASANTASIRFGISSDAFSNGVRITAHTNYSATNATEMSFATCGSASGTLIERVRIDSSGNVGIGTTSPTSKLTVAGAMDATYPNLVGQTNIFSTDSMAIDKGGVLSLSGSYTGTTMTTFASLYGRKENATDGNVAGYLAFLTRGASDTGTEKMRITSTGNVGIGTSTINNRLEVSGRVRASTGLIAVDNLWLAGGEFYLGTESGTTDDSWRMYPSSGNLIYASRKSGTWTERLRIDSAGSVIASVDVRSPIFYDGNDTAYYVNPNGISYIADLYIDAKLKHSGYSGTRYFTFGVGNVSNTKAKLHFSGWFWGNIEISATSAFNYANRPGIVKKRYAFGGSPTGTEYINESRIVESMGATPNGITFGEIFWDSAVSKWAIIVASLDGSANAYQLEVKCFCPDSTSRDAIIDSMTMTATYTSDTTAYTYANSGYKKLIIGGTVASPSTFSIKQTADNGAGAFQIENFGSTNSWYLQIGSDQNLYVKYNDGARGVFNNSTGAYTTVSDSRVKKDISNISFGLDTISRLRPVEYRMIDNVENSAKNLGFIAQEVLEVIPSSVTQMHGGMYGLDKSEIIPVIVKALQELKADNDSLRARVAALESK